MNKHFSKIIVALIIAAASGAFAAYVDVQGLKIEFTTYKEDIKEIKNDLKALRCMGGDQVSCKAFQQ